MNTPANRRFFFHCRFLPIFSYSILYSPIMRNKLLLCIIVTYYAFVKSTLNLFSLKKHFSFLISASKRLKNRFLRAVTSVKYNESITQVQGGELMDERNNDL